MFPYPVGPFGNMMPYSNFHSLNQDWMISKIKENADGIIALNDRIDDIIIENTDIFLRTTNDNTDRTAEILKLLNTTGCCFLGPGTFVIKSTINMPDNSALMGVGNGTVLRLADDSNDDIAVNVGTLCTVSDMTIVGSTTDLPYEQYNRGTRKGVALLGDFTTFGQGSYSHNYAKLNNLTIKNFNHSGIWAFRNDGAASFLATNIDILRCHAGINIEQFSEFHSFANIRCRWCNVACVMQGGNNLFTNCHFDVNIMGIKIDGDTNDIVNGDHSSFSNCSICHSDNNNGYAIYATKSIFGICFSNCQIWYGKIYLHTCSGFKFSNCIMAGCQVDVTNSNSVTFLGNLFRDQSPSITFTGCINCIFENNQDGYANIIVNEVDRGSNRNLNASIMRVADIDNLQFEVLGVCTASNIWSVAIPLPNLFSMDSFHFDVNRIVLLGRGSVADADLDSIAVTVNTAFVRVDNIKYTGTVGDTCIIDVRAHVYQIS